MLVLEIGTDMRRWPSEKHLTSWLAEGRRFKPCRARQFPPEIAEIPLWSRKAAHPSRTLTTGRSAPTLKYSVGGNRLLLAPRAPLVSASLPPLTDGTVHHEAGTVPSCHRNR